jgi:hypothetical protein
MLGGLKIARLVVLTLIAVLSTISACSKDKNPTRPPVGHGWSALGSGTNYIVNALTVYNGRLIAGGDFDTAGAVSANKIAAWSE